VGGPLLSQGRTLAGVDYARAHAFFSDTLFIASYCCLTAYHKNPACMTMQLMHNGGAAVRNCAALPGSKGAASPCQPAVGLYHLTPVRVNSFESDFLREIAVSLLMPTDREAHDLPFRDPCKLDPICRL